MCKEYYFNNLFFNNNTCDTLIIPKTYNKGKIILDTNNEICFFYEMYYYDNSTCIKYLLDTNIELQSRLNKLDFYYNLLCEHTCNIIPTFKTKINIFHNDYNKQRKHNYEEAFINNMKHLIYTSFEEDISESVRQIMYGCNVFIYNNKCVLIDYEDCTRIDTSKPPHNPLKRLKRYLQDKYI